MNRWMKKMRLIVVALTLLVGVGAFAYHTLGHSSAMRPTRFEPELKENGSEIVVRTFRISDYGLNQQTLAYTGTIQARYQAPVGFRVAGKISSRHVEVGAKVCKGDLLFQLDPVDFELQLRVAESDVASAQSLVQQSKAEEKRLHDLLSSRSVSQSDYDVGLAARDVAIARLESAMQRLELAKNQRSYCELVADSDGLVVSLSGETGQVVTVGQPVLSLMSGDQMEAVVSLPETLVADLSDRTASVRFWSHPQSSISAELRELSPLADPISRTFDARFQLNARPAFLAIGMTATVELKVDTPPSTELPITALANRDQSTIVWCIEESTGQVQPSRVEVIRYQNDFAIVKSDLKPGDLIVSAGVQRIDPSVRVRKWITE